MARKFKKQKKTTSWYNKKYSPMEVAAKAWQGVKYIKSIVNVERKTFDVTGGFSIVDGSGTLVPLTLIPIGDAYNTRDGNSIKLQSFYLTYRTILSTAAVNGLVRVMVLYDTEYNGTALATSQVLESVASVVSTISPLNHTIGSRVKVLCDKYVELTTAGKSSDISEYYKDVEHHIKFDDANITTTTLREGHIYLLVIGDATTNQPGFTYYSRTRFVDN